MKTIMIRAALACASLILSATSAFAEGGTIPSIPVGLDHDPEGIVTHGTTDARGGVTFAGLRPGRYAVVLTGRDLIAALDRIGARGGRRAPCLAIAIVGGSVAASPIPPVCRDSAGRGLRVGFTVRGRPGAGDLGARSAELRVTISDQGSTSNLSSY